MEKEFLKTSYTSLEIFIFFFQNLLAARWSFLIAEGSYLTASYGFGFCNYGAHSTRSLLGFF